MALSRQHAQKRLHLIGPHATRVGHLVSFGMPKNKKPHPIEVGLFGAKAIVQVPNPLPNLVQNTKRLQRWVAGFHSMLYNCTNKQYMHRQANVRAGFRRF